MKRRILILLLQMCGSCFCQDIPQRELEDELQSISENNGSDPDDDVTLEHWDHLHKHPLNLNNASEEQLLQLPFVTPLMIKNFLLYRSALGKLVHINELQAVPGWYPEFIRKILPFVTIDEVGPDLRKLSVRFRKLRASLLLRVSQSLQNQDPSPPAFIGSAQHVLMKVGLRSGNELQFGALVEKDAGEQWVIHGAFDFNSIYFFARNLGWIKSIAIGDFQVNMGQGLIQWQGIARKKSGNVIFINQQDELIQPYHSAGEFKFHRGLALTLAKKNLEWMVYASVRKLSANLKNDSLQNSFVTSISNSGNHRTAPELEDRNQLQQLSAGTTLSYSNPHGRVSINCASFQFSHRIQKQEEPYNLFSFQGKQMQYISLDYAYTISNLHCFGEFATDRELHKAFVSGAMLSLDKNLDCSFLFRSISRKYSSLYANAFTENSTVSNETGFYAGLSLRITQAIRVDGYVDLFYFPWLKYRVDAPSAGKELFVQLNYQPNKRLLLQARCKFEKKESDDDNITNSLQQLNTVKKITWRSQFNWQLSKKSTLSERIETSSFGSGLNESSGFLLYNDFNFHPPMKPYDCAARILFFQTDSYDARIYAFERDVQYGFSVPAYSGKGIHYAVTIHYDFSRFLARRHKRSLDIWMSWSQAILGKNNNLINFQNDTSAKNQSSIRFQAILGS